jgi:hypothetical protein
MMMKASPRTTFEMIQPQIILGALIILFDVPAGAAQLQASGFGGRSVEMGQVVVTGFGVSRRPVYHPPDFFQFVLQRSNRDKKADGFYKIRVILCKMACNLAEMSSFV